MPVRIYDIAKKLGIENKEVLTKAKELGIATARVPSSSLDKITAEYLESHLKPAARVAAEPTAAPLPPEPIVLVTAPPPEVSPPSAPEVSIAPPAETETETEPEPTPVLELAAAETTPVVAEASPTAQSPGPEPVEA